jgi:tetratricopeptide (TPR) repeat protein
MKKYDLALEDIDRNIALTGITLDLKVIKAGIYHLMDNISKANEILETIWDDEFSKPDAFVSRGYYYMEFLQDYHSAIRDFSSALEIDPYLSKAYLYRSQAKGYLDDDLGSRSDIIKYNNIKD